MLRHAPHFAASLNRGDTTVNRHISASDEFMWPKLVDAVSARRLFVIRSLAAQQCSARASSEWSAAVPFALAPAPFRAVAASVQFSLDQLQSLKLSCSSWDETAPRNLPVAFDSHGRALDILAAHMALPDQEWHLDLRCQHTGKELQYMLPMEPPCTVLRISPAVQSPRCDDDMPMAPAIPPVPCRSTAPEESAELLPTSSTLPHLLAEAWAAMETSSRKPPSATGHPQPHPPPPPPPPQLQRPTGKAVTALEHAAVWAHMALACSDAAIASWLSFALHHDLQETENAVMQLPAEGSGVQVPSVSWAGRSGRAASADDIVWREQVMHALAAHWDGESSAGGGVTEEAGGSVVASTEGVATRLTELCGDWVKQLLGAPPTVLLRLWGATLTSLHRALVVLYTAQTAMTSLEQSARAILHTMGCSPTRPLPETETTVYKVHTAIMAMCERLQAGVDGLEDSLLDVTEGAREAVTQHLMVTTLVDVRAQHWDAYKPYAREARITSGILVRSQ